MSHVDDGQLNALLDGELPPAEARAVELHVAECAECAARLEEARAFLAGAGELLAILSPPGVAAPPVAVEPPVPLVAPVSPVAPAGPKPADASPAPRVIKTSKEIAVSIDGRTAVTPAIRPVFPHEVPPVPVKRSWRLPDLEKLAWAASLVLCLGVGYLANEVYHLRQRGSARYAASPVQEEATHDVAAAPAGERGASGALTVRSGASGRSQTGTQGPARQPVATPKPPPSKPNQTTARPGAEQLAANEPADAVDRAAMTSAAPTGSLAAPAPAARERTLQAPTTSVALGAATNSGAGQPAAPTAGVGARAAEAPRRDEASAERSAPTAADAAPARSTTFRRVPMEEAVRSLSGSIRLIDGMNPQRVDIGPGNLVPGADPERDIVRVTYSAAGKRLVLDQQLGDTQSGATFNGLMQGDTLVTTAPNGSTQVRWVDRKFWLSLTGTAAADSVRALVERIR